MKTEHKVLQELVKEFQNRTEELFQALKTYGDDEDKWDAEIQIANVALRLSATLRNDVMETRFLRDHPEEGEEYETLEDKMRGIQKELVRKGMEPASADVLHAIALITLDDNGLYSYTKLFLGWR